MVYQQYTISSSSEMLVIYRCSACHKWNAQKHVISGKGYYNDQGAFLSSQMAKRRERAEDAAENEMWKIRNKIYAETKQRRYRTARFHMRCSTCQHQEPWAKMSFNSAGCISAIGKHISFIMACIVALPMVDGASFVEAFNSLGMFKYLMLLALAMWLLPYAYIYISRWLLEPKIAKMDEDSLPHICWDDAAVKKTLMEIMKRESAKDCDAFASEEKPTDNFPQQ